MNCLAKAAAAALTVWGCSTAFALTEPGVQGADVSALAGQSASADAIYAERWIRHERDNHGHPFAIVDKKAARIFVFSGDGRLVGSSPALLGATRGDIAVPGSERKAPSQLLPNEQRTPSGRFHSVPGRNNFGEDVVWVDYDSSIAIHRVRPGRAAASRMQSLANTLPDDKRRSLGCVVVPEPFLAGVVLPTLGHAAGTIYILPEEEPVQAMFAPLTPPTLTAATTRTAVAAPALRAAPPAGGQTVTVTSTPAPAPMSTAAAAAATPPTPRAITVLATPMPSQAMARDPRAVPVSPTAAAPVAPVPRVVAVVATSIAVPSTAPAPHAVAVTATPAVVQAIAAAAPVAPVAPAANPAATVDVPASAEDR